MLAYGGGTVLATFEAVNAILKTNPDMQTFPFYSYPAIWWGWTPPLTHVRFAVDPLANLTMFLFPALILGTYLAASTMR